MPPLDARGFGGVAFLLRRRLIRDFDGEVPVSPAFARLLRRAIPEPVPCSCGRCGACEARLQEERHEFYRQRELSRSQYRERGGRGPEEW